MMSSLFLRRQAAIATARLPPAAIIFPPTSSSLPCIQSLQSRLPLLSSFPFSSSSDKKTTPPSTEKPKRDALAEHLKRMKIKDLRVYVPGLKSSAAPAADKNFLTPTAISAIGRKRGGRKFVKQEIRIKEEEARTKPFVHETGGGHFPSARYSPEETLKLLEEAYSSLPLRGGPRRSRRAKRMRAKFIARDKNAVKQKMGRIVGHERRQERRHRRTRECLAVKAGAAEVVEAEKAYRDRVLVAYRERGMIREGGYKQWTVLDQL
eukprot:CAMPEP_0194269310 /NCGR_PEP_ID=MMETSP0169-20130528/3502_1 /TAXON_ID=218684 /ORGANISM="Corethron pennatum, Strain L29A3" /LENGTH=263 /DNA_ID=CAMNT_0039010919 /DNA_START=71 /DNA_END=862 /DNA_ORIENTATION=-